MMPKTPPNQPEHNDLHENPLAVPTAVSEWIRQVLEMTIGPAADAPESIRLVLGRLAAVAEVQADAIVIQRRQRFVERSIKHYHSNNPR